MTSSYLEREVKFDVDPDFVVPDVEALLPADGTVETAIRQLRSDYFDTDTYALLRARVTLRRRTGEADTGWQLKVPADAFREEISVPDNDGGVPEELAALIAGIVHGRALRPVATVSTTRSLTRLLDRDGRLMAEIADDTVRASAGGDTASLSTWREVEVELGGDELELLGALSKRMRRAGARSSVSSSKLARALGRDVGPATRPQRRRAGDVIGDYVAQQHRQIMVGDLALRRGNESVVHSTRVATRRLRSTLRVFAELFETNRAAALDEELRWYAALLGEVRDQQVMQSRLRTMIGEVEPTLLLGPVRTRVNREIRRDWLRSWKALQAALTSDRYYSLLGELEEWVQAPPLTARADRGPKILGERVQQAERTVAKRLKAAVDTGDVTQMHKARKAAKRARYANEATAEVIGAKSAKRGVTRYRDLQDLLGEHQDSIVSAALLRRMGAKAGTLAGENGFTFGLLYERELARAHRAEAETRRFVKRLRR